MKLSFTVLTLLLATTAANAQSTSVKASDVQSSQNVEGETRSGINQILGNKQFKDDQTLTDPKLRADAGSMSQFSLKANLSYYGPIASDLSVADQPNPDGGVGSTATAISGSLGLRYRLDPKTTMSMGTGIKQVHPFHSEKRLDVNSPYLSYDMSERFGNLQMRNSPGIGIVTLPEYIDIGEYASLDYTNSLVYNITDTKLAIGLDSSFSYFLYNREYSRKDKATAARNNLSFSPNVKYIFNDKINLNASISKSWYNPRRLSDESAFLPRSATGSIGLGYSYSKDIYISPYIRLYPSRLTSDSTTLNISTSFSVL